MPSSTRTLTSSGVSDREGIAGGGTENALLQKIDAQGTSLSLRVPELAVTTIRRCSFFFARFCFFYCAPARGRNSDCDPVGSLCPNNEYITIVHWSGSSSQYVPFSLFRLAFHHRVPAGCLLVDFAVDMQAEEDQNYVTASERFLELQTQVQYDDTPQLL